MPELPEVETVLRGLRARVLGRTIATVDVRNPLVVVGAPEQFREALLGRSIQRVVRKGKALAMELAGRDGSEPRYLVLRLGMTGQFTLARREAPPAPHTHLRLALDDAAEELRYRDTRRFGRVRCCAHEELEEIFSRLGPDAREISEEDFLRALCGRRGALKSLLMNQAAISGLGNIYADEALFMACLHPLTIAGRISPKVARRLRRAIQKVLDRAVHLQGTSFRDYIDIEGRPGNFLPRLRVYGRAGKPCRRCSHLIRRIVVAGRSSHYCPRCQPRTALVRGQPRPRQTARMRGPRTQRRQCSGPAMRDRS